MSLTLTGPTQAYVSEHSTSFGSNINLATFGDILVNFLRIMSTKSSTISEKIKTGKLFFISFSTLRIFYSNMATFEGGGSLHIVYWDRVNIAA